MPQKCYTMPLKRKLGKELENITHDNSGKITPYIVFEM